MIEVEKNFIKVDKLEDNLSFKIVVDGLKRTLFLTKYYSDLLELEVNLLQEKLQKDGLEIKEVRFIEFNHDPEYKLYLDELLHSYEFGKGVIHVCRIEPLYIFRFACITYRLWHCKFDIFLKVSGRYNMIIES